MIFFLFFFFIFELNSFFEKKNSVEVISDENSFSINNIFSFSEDYEKIKVAYSFEGSNNLVSDFIFNSILNAFKIGGEIKLYNVKSEKGSLRDIYKKLKNENIYFYIMFFENDSNFSWKIYSVFEEKFLEGATYKKLNSFESKIDLKRVICSDLWKLLFDNDKTPFDSFVAYINSLVINGKKYSEIITVSPFFDDSRKIRLKTNRAISDLGCLISDENSVIVFSEITSKNVRIVKLKNNGVLSILVDLPGTSGSLCAIDNDIFYIRSSKIYHCYYNFEKKSFVHEKIATPAKNDLNASICKGSKKNMMICARNYKIYKIFYEKNSDGSVFVVKEELLSPKDSFATSVDFVEDSQFIFSTEKIGKYNQIFSYNRDNFERKQITNSNYSKTEVTISPCGTYIAYSVKDEGGKKRIEIMNIYTKKTKIITEEAGKYSTPVWVFKKI